MAKKVENEQQIIKNLEFSITEMRSREIPTISETKSAGKNYVNWGEDNRFPNYLWSMYLQSAILQSIINGTVDFVVGNGVIANELPEIVNSDGETLEEVISKITLDYMIYGGYAFNIIRNFDGDIAEIYWLNVGDCRLNEDETKLFYCDKWNKYGSKPVEYPLFDPKKKQKSSVYYFKGHISRGIYPIPTYNGALAAIETSTEIGKFHLNNILNNLTTSAIISFNNGIPTDEEKKLLERKMKEKFTGADNAGRFMLVFNNDKDHGVEIARLSEDNMDQKFQTLSQSTKEEIFTAFRAQPMLFGMLPNNTAFNKNEFLEAFELYNKCTVTPIQRDIKKAFRVVYGRDVIDFKTFSLSESGDVKNIVVENK